MEEFEIGAALEKVREAVRPFPRAAMFELADEGYGSVFHQLVGFILSIRTTDEVVLPTARQLFSIAPTPSAMASLSVDQIDEVIRKVGLHGGKAPLIRELAIAAANDPSGDLPPCYDLLTRFKGVGPKCANLALGIADGQARIAVDVHVFRVVNRWGYVVAPTPEATLRELEAILPTQYHVEINAMLVPFGKHICTARKPKCASCLLNPVCPKRGVPTLTPGTPSEARF